MASPRRSRRWSPAAASFAPNPDFRTGRAFASTDHLAADAVVAYVDGVLSPTARSRAQAHLDLCEACSSEVAAQEAARAALRSCSTDVPAPQTLRGRLNSIPTNEIDLRAVGERTDGEATER
ncbi:MAG: zf-HC2 domain-containing protein [Gordonia sp. (in: high G+C Gram-positive bacteria)]|uniref:zf-HC2 domain-containing protein n=1 Tax=Gordonia sp. (in: high G+C Gram-positive bacteria) TaxID=84139 RepID=UPI0039E59404